jgi:hypothetical protein
MPQIQREPVRSARQRVAHPQNGHSSGR